ncbi:MAG: amino acid dehydrogenase, partial [Gammaproteobacteria bacterium]|nr:amino acid dehydrogenase [Gammaproteobacteria bacterium]
MKQIEIQGHPDFDNHESVVFESSDDLSAIIAVHNTGLGPAVGGCRMFPYASLDDALTDVLRLSRGMTYKSALAGLPLGGGKSVIIGDPQKDKTRAMLLAMGEFIDSLQGQYVTAEDSGTSVED